MNGVSVPTEILQEETVGLVLSPDQIIPFDKDPRQMDGVNQDGRSNDKHLGRLDGVSGRGLSGHEITSCG